MTAPATVGVGLLGAGAIGRVHAHAYRVLAHALEEPAVVPRLVAVAGRPGSAGGERRGFARRTGDWRELVADPDVALLDNCGPNDLHAEPTIAAARAGRAVVCEKPLGRGADEAFEIWRQVAATGVAHLCGFHLRFVPAIAFARELIRSGELGEVLHFRARYLQGWLLDAPDRQAAAWRFDGTRAGTGVLGDLGSHLVDLARHLAGEPVAVTGTTTTFDLRGGSERTVDDAFAATIELAGGALGTLEASRVCPGPRNALVFEVNGSRGSLAFDLTALNELRLTTTGSALRDRGWRTIAVTEPGDPSIEAWWPTGRVVGWEHAFVAQLGHALRAVAEGRAIGPPGATFEDGYRAAETCAAIARAAATGTRQQVAFRALSDDLTTAPLGATTGGVA